MKKSISAIGYDPRKQPVRTIQEADLSFLPITTEADFEPYYNYGIQGRILYWICGSTAGRKLAITALCVLFMTMGSAINLQARGMSLNLNAKFFGNSSSELPTFAAAHQEEETITISGKLHNVIGQPAAEISVGLYNQDEERIASAESNELGEFSLVYEPEPVSTPGNRNIPEKLDLSAGYPNPFMHQTRFELAIPQEQSYQISVYDVTGRLISRHQQNLSPGRHNLRFDGQLAAGVYLVRIVGDETSVTQKITALGQGSLNVPIRLRVEGAATTEVPEISRNYIQSDENWTLRTEATDWYEAFELPIDRASQSGLEIALVDALKNVQLSGTLQNQFEEAVGDVQVQLTYGDHILSDSQSDEQGNFADDFDMPVRWTDSLAVLSMKRDGFDALSFQTPLAAEMKADTMLIQQTYGAIVQGRISDEDDQPLHEADVQLYHAETDSLLGTTTTREDGHYEIHWQTEQGADHGLIILAEKESYFPETDTLDYDIAAEWNAQLQSSIAVVSGHITGIDESQLPGANVRLYTDADSLLAETVSGELGEFEMSWEFSRDADYALKLIAEADFYEPKLTEWEFAQISEQNVALEPEFVTISGIITNADEETVSGITVHVVHSGKDSLKTAISETDGSFELSYTLAGVAQADSTQLEIHSVADELYLSSVKDVEYGAQTLEIVLDDKTIESTITITVENDLGTIANADISIQPVAITGQTNAVGTFEASYQTPVRKTDTLPDNYEISIEAENNHNKEIEVAYEESLSLDVLLDRIIPITQTSFTLNVYDANGSDHNAVDQLNNLEYFVQAGNEEVQSFNPSNGEVSISLEHPENIDELKIWHNNSGNHFSYMIILRDPNSVWYENPFNNNMIKNWEHGQVFDTLRVATSDLNGETFDAYHLPFAFDHSSHGRMLIHGDTLAPMMYGRNRGTVDGQFQGVNHFWNKFEGYDKVDYFIRTWEQNSGEPIAQDQLDQMIDRTDHVLGFYTLENGVELLDYDVHVIDSNDDPKWQETADRNFNNMHYTRRWNSQPGNNVNIRGPPQYEREIRNSNSHYPINTSRNTITEEIWEGMNHTIDPIGLPPGNSSTTYIMEGTDGTLNEIGKVMMRWKANSSRGTRLYWENPFTQDD